MGRGRQKAKATRVARDLKYSSQDMDLKNFTVKQIPMRQQRMKIHLLRAITSVARN